MKIYTRYQRHTCIKFEKVDKNMVFLKLGHTFRHQNRWCITDHGRCQGQGKAKSTEIYCKNITQWSIITKNGKCMHISFLLASIRNLSKLGLHNNLVSVRVYTRISISIDKPSVWRTKFRIEKETLIEKSQICIKQDVDRNWRGPV